MNPTPKKVPINDMTIDTRDPKNDLTPGPDAVYIVGDAQDLHNLRSAIVVTTQIAKFDDPIQQAIVMSSALSAVTEYIRRFVNPNLNQSVVAGDLTCWTEDIPAMGTDPQMMWFKVAWDVPDVAARWV